MDTPFDLAAAKLEYKRLYQWRDAWTRRADDRVRMRRLGGLQRTQDKVESRAMLCNYRIASLMRKVDNSVQASKSANQSERQALIASALAKLTNAEREALGL